MLRLVVASRQDDKAVAAHVVLQLALQIHADGAAAAVCAARTGQRLIQRIGNIDALLLAAVLALHVIPTENEALVAAGKHLRRDCLVGHVLQRIIVQQRPHLRTGEQEEIAAARNGIVQRLQEDRVSKGSVDIHIGLLLIHLAPLQGTAGAGQYHLAGSAVLVVCLIPVTKIAVSHGRDDAVRRVFIGEPAGKALLPDPEIVAGDEVCRLLLRFVGVFGPAAAATAAAAVVAAVAAAVIIRLSCIAVRIPAAVSAVLTVTGAADRRLHSIGSGLLLCHRRDLQQG